MSTIGRRLRFALMLVLVIAATAAAHQRVRAFGSLPDESRFVPRPEAARLLAAGFDPVLADYYWLQAVQIVGAHHGDFSAGAARIGELIDVVTYLNPWVSHAYRFAAVWLTGSEDQILEANRLLKRGIAYHPTDWRNRFYLGFNHFYYLGESQTAADVLEGALELSGGPAAYGGPDIPEPPLYLRRLVARLRAQGGELETAAAFLAELARGAPNPESRRQYEEALVELETERRARILDAARERYRAERGGDIAEPEDLLRVLGELPPEPRGGSWVLDESGRIVSSYYGRRYEPHLGTAERERRLRWANSESKPLKLPKGD